MMKCDCNKCKCSDRWVKRAPRDRLKEIIFLEGKIEAPILNATKQMSYSKWCAMTILGKCAIVFKK